MLNFRNVSKENLDRDLRNCLKSVQKGPIIFYYSGHGLMDAIDSVSIVCKDGELFNIEKIESNRKERWVEFLKYVIFRHGKNFPFKQHFYHRYL